MNSKMYFILVLVLFMVAFVAVKNIKAQAHVESASYDLMLSTLLKHSVPELSISDVENDSTGIFIDTREKKEFEVSHIPNAKWVGYDDFDTARLKGIARDQKIIVYCSVGYRSEKIAEKLINAGYTNVSNLYGGVFEWVNRDNVVVDSSGNTTEKIHAYSKKWGIWLNKGTKVYD